MVGFSWKDVNNGCEGGEDFRAYKYTVDSRLGELMSIVSVSMADTMIIVRLIPSRSKAPTM